MARDTHVAPSIAPGSTTWEQYKTGSLTTILDRLIEANPPIAAPTLAPVVAITTAAGGLPAGVYTCSFTYRDSFGETTTGPSSAEFELSGPDQLATVTLPERPDGVLAANLYLSAPGSSPQSQALFASGLLGQSVTLALNVPAPANWPAATTPEDNTTGAATWSDRIRAILPGQSAATFHRLGTDLSNYLDGEPLTRRQVLAAHAAWSGIAATWATALAEASTLVTANLPDQTDSTADPRGMPADRWILP